VFKHVNWGAVKPAFLRRKPPSGRDRRAIAGAGHRWRWSRLCCDQHRRAAAERVVAL